MLRWVLRLTLVLGGGFGAFILSALIQLRVGRADCPDLPGVDQICVGPTPDLVLTAASAAIGLSLVWMATRRLTRRTRRMLK